MVIFIALCSVLDKCVVALPDLFNFKALNKRPYGLYVSF